MDTAPGGSGSSLFQKKGFIKIIPKFSICKLNTIQKDKIIINKAFHRLDLLKMNSKNELKLLILNLINKLDINF